MDHSFDGNGITGPDWGRSEVVFGCFPPKRFQPAALLSGTFHIVLVSSMLYFILVNFIIALIAVLSTEDSPKELTFPSFCYLMSL